MSKIIASVILDDALVITFEDGKTVKLSDEGQSCCEHRYMTCDDNLSTYVGAEYRGWELKGTDYCDSEDCHEVQFLEVTTTNGSITVESHNEHNGYYGGFHIQETRGY